MTINTFGPANSSGPYLPPEQDFPEDNTLFREILTQRERLTASAMNLREIAQYEKTETQTGQQWFTTIANGAVNSSYVFRLSFDLVALNGGVPIPSGGPTTLTLSTTVPPPNGTQPQPINIPTTLLPVHGFGGATNASNFYFINDPLLFVRLNIWTNALQQIIITNNTGSALTQCYWVFEYIKT